MSRVRYHMANVLSIAAGVVIGLTIFVAATSGYDVVPRLGGKLFPVVRFGPATDIFRQSHDEHFTTGRACFTLHMKKLAEAIPAPYQFNVSTLYGNNIKIAVNLANANNTRAHQQRYDPHPVGATWARRYCFELPGTISDSDEMTVNGLAYHDRVLPLIGPNPFWQTETVIPPVVIPAVKRSWDDQ